MEELIKNRQYIVTLCVTYDPEVLMDHLRSKEELLELCVNAVDCFLDTVPVSVKEVD